MLRILLIAALILLLRKLIWCLRWLWCYYHNKELPENISALPRQSGRVFEEHLRQAAAGPEAPALSAEPDEPVPFGYQTAWLAVKCQDPEQVIAALHPQMRQRANWQTGVHAACAGQGVFVSPCLDGFVLVIGSGSLGADLAVFPEVQAFCSYRTCHGYSWGKYVYGSCLRLYESSDSRVSETGLPTPEELALGFDRFPGDAHGDGSGRFPGEEDVLDIAAAWGVDPRFEKKNYPPSAGWLCAVPRRWKTDHKCKQ